MQKCFLFSLCNGCYEYAIAIIQAESLEEAVKISKKEENNYLLSSSNNIQGYNFDYKKEFSKRRYIQDNFRDAYYAQQTIFYKSGGDNYEEKLQKWCEQHYIFNCNYPPEMDLYAFLLENFKEKRHLEQDTFNQQPRLFVEGEFYDVMECMMPVPEGYIYSNGHSG